jgi:hypothetical protein
LAVALRRAVLGSSTLAAGALFGRVEHHFPYKQVKRALKAEIDESVWASLYAAVSRPFEKPETGKIAIKVINHYGDEVLKVYSA